MKISILNYSTGEVEILNVPKEDSETIEDTGVYLESIGYKLNEISYMVTEDFFRLVIN